MRLATGAARWALALSACDGGRTNDKDTTVDGVQPGGVEVRTGLGLDVLRSVVAPGEQCGFEPPVTIGDLDGDGTPDPVVTCGHIDLQIQVLDGGALADGRWVPQAEVHAESVGVSAVGDLDGDGAGELGLIRSVTMLGGEQIRWYVRPSASLAGVTDGMDGALTLLAPSEQYGGDAVLPIGDADADGTDDLAVWTEPGGDDPVLYVLSGARLASEGSLVATSALRSVSGFARDDVVDGVALLDDVDGDGVRDLAVGDSGDDPYAAVRRVPEVRVVLGPSLTDPVTSFGLRGSTDGVHRTERVLALPDLDGDGLAELAVALSTFDSRSSQLAVVPGAALAARVDLDVARYDLGGVPETGTAALFACDLDGDGLLELVTDAGTWDGRDLLVPGALPVGPGAPKATCAGDLDGVLGAEVVAGVEWLSP